MNGKNKIAQRLAPLIVFAVSLMLVFSAGVQTANADESGIPQTVDELLDIYGIGDEPSDYIVVVDTSGSMMQKPPIYPKVQKAFTEFTKAIQDTDHLSVITFDTTAVVRFNGRMTGKNRKAAASALPKEARGARTDIGAALEAALERMERPDAASVQTMIFLTDGMIDAPGASYQVRGNKHWKQLTKRAKKVEAGRSVSVYGAGLGGEQTDVDVVSDVFPRAKIVSLPNNQLADFFDEAVKRSRIERLRIPVSEELRRNPVQAIVTVSELRDRTSLSLRFDSKLPNLGVTVSLKGVSVYDDDGKPLHSSLAGGPRSETIGPKQSTEPAKITVEVPNLSKDLRIGQIPETRSLRVEVDASVEVEPAAILASDLAIEQAPELTGPELVNAKRMHGIAYWMIAVFAVILVLVGLFLRWVYQRFFAIPRLRGGLELPDGSVVSFRGKEEEIPSRRFDFDSGGARAVFFTKRGKYTRFFSTRHPRIFVMSDRGIVKVSSMGSTADQIDEVGIIVGISDQIVVGPTRLFMVATKGKAN